MHDSSLFSPEVRRLIRYLNLSPHPEGGYFAETYRDANELLSHIYYLLKKGQRSHWHKLKKNENLHFYDGDPLKVFFSNDKINISEIILGRDLQNNQHYNFTIEAGTWFSMCTIGAWSLIGCVVAPAFSYQDFELAPPNWKPGKVK